MEDNIIKIIEDMKDRHLMRNGYQEVMVIPSFEWECFEKRLIKIDNEIIGEEK